MARDSKSAYYDVGGIETLDIIEAKVRDPESYILGNILKYASRLQHKGDEQNDARKIRIYAERLEELVNNTDKNDEQYSIPKKPYAGEKTDDRFVDIFATSGAVCFKCANSDSSGVKEGMTQVNYCDGCKYNPHNDWTAPQVVNRFYCLSQYIPCCGACIYADYSAGGHAFPCNDCTGLDVRNPNNRFDSGSEDYVSYGIKKSS